MRKERVFLGTLLLLGGIVLVISKLGYFPDVNVFSLLFTVFLVGTIFKSILKMNFAGVLFPIAIICILYDDLLGVTAITPWTVLIAATLGSIGLSMIFNKHPKSFDKEFGWNSDDFEVIDIEDEGHIKLKTSFGSSIKYVNSNNFEQAQLDCSFGGMEVYFDNATMKDGKAVIQIEASFAGMELYIPRSWTVIDNTKVAFGAIEEKNKSKVEAQSNNTLMLIGNISFAGVEIIYV